MIKPDPIGARRTARTNGGSRGRDGLLEDGAPSSREINRRKAFLEFGAEDVRRLSALAPLAKRYTDEIVEGLYRHFLSLPESRRFLRDRAVLKKLKRMQKRYFLELTGGRYGEGYVRNRLLVGATHEAIGLPVQLYLGAYRRYLHLISEKLRSDRAGRFDAFQSMLKIIFFDMGLAIDTYVSRRERMIRSRNQELLRQSRELQRAHRIKDRFLANMSHELRTPLNSIIGFAELLNDGKLGPLGTAQRNYMSDMLGNARHLLDLIDGMLDLVQVDSGTMAFDPHPVDIADVLDEARRAFTPIAVSKHIQLRIELQCPGAPILDRLRLKQVVFNYLSNALKFTGRQGSVIMRARQEGHELVIEVADTGIGIRKRDLGRLFVDFQQLDVGISKRYQGTGLGLAITKRIVEAQGGRVGVRSRRGAGSTFFARLPLVHGADADSRCPAAAPGHSAAAGNCEFPNRMRKPSQWPDRAAVCNPLIGASSK